MFLEVKAASPSPSVEGTLGSSRGTQFRQIIFLIIESGMALLVIQLIRLVLYSIVQLSDVTADSPVLFAYFYIVDINEMFNVIIRSVHFYFFCFTDNFHLARASHQQ